MFDSQLGTESYNKLRAVYEICNRYFCHPAHIKAERIWVVVPATYKIGQKLLFQIFRDTMLCDLIPFRRWPYLRDC